MALFAREYDLPLTDWILSGLNIDNLQRIVDLIDQNKPLDEIKVYSTNRKFIEKIMREEAIKQFPEQERPVLEVILNSIDAKPENCEQYNIWVEARPKYVTICDAGKAMTLYDVLSDLIVPFSTQKEGIETIGKFGVGFLSTLNYCLKDLRNSIDVETNTGLECNKMTFYSTGSEVSDLRMKLNRKVTNLHPGLRSTKVTIRTKNNLDGLQKYLANQLADIPIQKAAIYVNNEQINPQTPDRLHREVEFDVKGKKLKQFVSLAIDNNERVKLVSQGVRVRERFADSLGAVLNFPSAVNPVEGRDEFKQNDNYFKAVDCIYDLLEEYLRHVKLEYPSDASKLADLVKDVAFATSGHPKNMSTLQKLIFNDKKYILKLGDFSTFEDFIGPELDNIALVTNQASTYEFWKNWGKFEDFENDFLYDRAKYLDMPHLQIYPNLCLIYRHLDEPDHTFYTMKVVNPGSVGSRVFTFSDRHKVVYVNAAHPYVASDKFDYKKAYALFNDFLINIEEPRSLKELRQEIKLVVRDVIRMISRSNAKAGGS